MRDFAEALALTALVAGALLEPGCGGRVSQGSSQAASESDGLGGGGTAGAMPEGVGGVHSIVPDPGTTETAVGGSGWWSEEEHCDGVPFEGSSFADNPNLNCAGVSIETEFLPIHLFIVLDRSTSMTLDLSGGSPAPPGRSRWEGIRAGLEAFMDRPEAVASYLGLQFFGHDLGGGDTVNCNPSIYSEPAVPDWSLPAVAPDVVAALDEVGDQLGGPTPTVPALEGAMEYNQLIQYTTAGPSIVLLVTGALPTQCQDHASVAELADVAGQALANDMIFTFVIGLGPGLEALHDVAEAGGTDAAYLIESGDLAVQFQDALLRLIAPEWPFACQIEIPLVADPTRQIDPDLAELVIYPYRGEPQEIPRVASSEACADSPNGGWFYDQMPYPERVLLCPCSCRSDVVTLEMRFGCYPRF